METVKKFCRVHRVLWETMQESENLELLCRVEDETQWENALGLLCEEIINNLGGGDPEQVWSQADRKRMQLELAEAELQNIQKRIEWLKSELSNG